jgi:hypothetical protein
MLVHPVDSKDSAFHDDPKGDSAFHDRIASAMDEFIVVQALRKAGDIVRPARSGPECGPDGATRPLR